MTPPKKTGLFYFYIINIKEISYLLNKFYSKYDRLKSPKWNFLQLALPQVALAPG